jgi:hypothetical protein
MAAEVFMLRLSVVKGVEAGWKPVELGGSWWN